MTPPRCPADVLRTLADLLQARGLTRLYGCACAAVGVLSVTIGLTVWCDGRLLRWRHDGDETTWPAADPDGAARRLADLARPDSTP
jgi:hypothetical protein